MSSKEEVTDTVIQHQLFQQLLAVPVGTAIGVACSFLLFCATQHRTEFRRVMNERVVREGLSGISLLDVFKRQSQ